MKAPRQDHNRSASPEALTTRWATLSLSNAWSTAIRLFKAIDSDFNLIGAGIVYIDSRGTMVTLREFEPICQIKPVNVVLIEPMRTRSTAEVIGDIKTGKRGSKLAQELLSAGLSCGAAVLGWVAVIVSTGAVPVTGGASTAVTVISYSAAAAGTASAPMAWHDHGRNTPIRKPSTTSITRNGTNTPKQLLMWFRLVEL